jgi:hypothetical protein
MPPSIAFRKPGRFASQPGTLATSPEPNLEFFLYLGVNNHE